MPNPYSSPNFTQAFVIAPSLTANITGPLQGDGSPTPYAAAFVSDTTGTVNVIPRETNTPVDIPVIAGHIVRLGIKRLVSVSTAMVVTGLL